MACLAKHQCFVAFFLINKLSRLLTTLKFSADAESRWVSSNSIPIVWQFSKSENTRSTGAMSVSLMATHRKARAEPQWDSVAPPIQCF